MKQIAKRITFHELLRQPDGTEFTACFTDDVKRGLPPVILKKRSPRNYAERALGGIQILGTDRDGKEHAIPKGTADFSVTLGFEISQERCLRLAELGGDHTIGAGSLGSVTPLGDESTTDRGFEYVEFEDIYGAPRSIQESSSAERKRLWLGVNDAKSLVPRMHLGEAEVRGLIARLSLWLETGSLLCPDAPVESAAPRSE